MNRTSATRRRSACVLVLLAALAAACDPRDGTPEPTPASTRTPGVTPASNPTASVSPTATATAAAPSPTPSATPLERRAEAPPPAAVVAAPGAATSPAVDLRPAPAGTGVAPRVRTFRTPMRNAPVPFLPPHAQGAAVPETADAAGSAEPARPAARAPATVTFRAIARSPLEGFALLVSYPLTAGAFVGSGDQVACTTAAAGAVLVANHRNDGTLRLLVASAQALPLPLAIACRFAAAPGATLDARALAVSVLEVTAGGVAADPALLTVGVDVR